MRSSAIASSRQLSISWSRAGSSRRASDAFANPPGLVVAHYWITRAGLAAMERA
jgi:hypothetical protein